MSEQESIDKILKGLKYTDVTFPCGFKLETTKEIFSKIKEIRCPLHGKDCYKTEVRCIRELK